MINPPAQRALGLLLAFGAGTGLSLYTIFFKQVAGNYPLAALMLAMFLVASVVSLPGYLLHLHKQARRGSLKLSHRWDSLALLLGVILSLLAGNFLMAAALGRAAPALVHVVHRTELIFTVLFAAWLLHESFNRWTLVAIALVFLGLVVMRWNDDLGAGGISWLVVALACSSAACFAIAPILTKFLLQQGYEPQSINAVRLLGNCCLLALLPANIANLLALPWEAVMFAGLAGCSGPLVGRLCHTYAIKFIKLSSASLVSMSAVVITFLLQFMIYGLVPSWFELAGAAIISSAVALTVVVTYRQVAE